MGWVVYRNLPTTLVVLACLIGGCATSNAVGESSGDEPTQRERKPPPEVTDHTVDDRPEFARTSRPVVEVSLDKGRLLGLEAGSYETSVRREAQRCYSRVIRLRKTEIEGSMVYEVLVTRNGRVAGTDVISSGLKDDAIHSCIEQLLGRLSFEVAVRNRPVFRLLFRLDSQLETLVPSEPPV